MKPKWDYPDEEYDCWSDRAYEPDPEWLKYLAFGIAAGLLLGAVYVLFGKYGLGGQ